MRRFVIVALSVLLIAAMVSPQAPLTDTRNVELELTENVVEFEKAQSYTPMAPMNISSNNDFVSLGWNGSGTPADPYTIENVEITGEYLALGIANTTAHFSVRDCSFSSQVHLLAEGIILHNLTNGEITGCTFSSCDEAIGIDNCNDTRFSDNTVYNCSIGVGVWWSSGIEISRNTISNGSRGGYFTYVFDSNITNNIVFDMFFNGFACGLDGNGSVVSDNILYDISSDIWMEPAIDISFASFWRIEHNTVYNCYVGIGSMWGALHCVVTSNNLTNNNVGIQMSISSDMEISDNVIAGGYSGMMLYQNEAIAIDNNTIDSTSVRGIAISWSTNCIVTSNHINSHGLYIQGMAPSEYLHTVSGNLNEDGKQIGYFVGHVDETIDATDYFQLYLVNCSNVIVENGLFSDTEVGVVFAFSDSCKLQQCSITENSINGIEFFYTTNCEITDCEIAENGHLWGSYGIQLLITNNTRITRNMIYRNNGSGIVLYAGASSYCFIYNNLISNNTVIGIEIHSGNNQNSIYGNAIGWNDEGNAVDGGSNNHWDDGVSMGNWWSDYNGTGVYEIDGSSNSVDNYPLQFKAWSATLPIEDSTGLGIEIIIVSIGLVGVIIVIMLLILKRRKTI
ncbi:MAG: right-handed parallel beta-helix repeat-containing protein [Candidatus Thorarchaeota archaeon]